MKNLAIYEHKIGVKDTAIMGSLSKLKKRIKGRDRILSN